MAKCATSRRPAAKPKQAARGPKVGRGGIELESHAYRWRSRANLRRGPK